MASCGGRIPGRRWGRHLASNARTTPVIRKSAIFVQTFMYVVGFVVALGVAGCTVKYGSPPAVDRLDRLVVGVSSQADVAQLLGAPHGHGMGRLSIDAEPRETWSYDYMEGDLSHMQVKYLILFFRQDLFDGYLWFSSAALTHKQ